LARIAVSKPLVLDVHDAFVLREVGRRETVAGGRVLDVEPPRRWEAGHADFLAARSAATDRRALAALLVEERGVVRAADVRVLTGVDAAVSSGEGARLVGLGPWVAAASIMERVSGEIDAHLRDQHAEHPLRAGVDAPSLRPVLARVHPLLADPGLADEVFDSLARTGRIARAGATVSLPSHRPTTEGNPEADRLTATVAAAEPTPPTVAELFARGFEPELLSAVCAEGRLVRVSADIVMTPDLVDRGRRAVAEGPAQGISVSSFREALGTSRKFAVPLLEYLDAQGVTVRRGDLRVLRGGG
jgi:selenocysteine-specific elongation factor